MIKLQKNASNEVVYNTLKNRILQLDLTPGTLVSESDMATKFSLSRTPVRDAFKALVNEGLLEVKPHIGTFVTPIDLKQISDFLYLREVLEKAIVSELITSFNLSQELTLRFILEEQRKLIDNNELAARAFAKSDGEFHKALFNAAGKGSLIHHIKAIGIPYQRFRIFLNLEDKGTVEKLYNEHLLILEYIKSKEKEKLFNLLSKHIYDGFEDTTTLISKYPDYFIISK